MELVALGPVIELESLNNRHQPLGPALLDEFGPKVLVRLAIDPFRQANEILRRNIIIDRISPPLKAGEKRRRYVETRTIGWSNLDGLKERSTIIPEIRNAHQISDDAAVGIMLLLIHELEHGNVQHVLQIGAGGDYMVQLSQFDKPIQVEASGIRFDKNGSVRGRRRKEKYGQVKKPGFVSVTAFKVKREETVHSLLHFVVNNRLLKFTKNG